MTGSLLRHILIMTGTGAVGLVAIFIGDLANMLFSILARRRGDRCGRGIRQFDPFLHDLDRYRPFDCSNIARVSGCGVGRRPRARRLASSALMLTLAASIALTLVVWVAVSPLLSLLGAEGRTLDLARSYLWILVPFLPPLAWP